MKSPSQRVFTIVVDIVDDHAELELRRTLANPGFDFGPITTVHFASFVILPKNTLERPKAKLVLECNIDGPIKPFLRDLVEHDVRRLFQHCEGCPERERLYSYLKRHVRRPHLYHIGTPYRSVRSIGDDFDECARLSAQLNPAAAQRLAITVRRPAPGMAEWWRWEVFKPWAAAVLVLVATAILLFATRIPWRAYSLFDRWLVAAFCSLGFVAACVGAAQQWLSSAAVHRDAVVAASVSIAATAVVVGIAARGGAPPRAVAALAVAGVVIAAWRVGEAITSRRNARLAQMRIAEDSSAPLELFPEFVRPPQTPPVVWRRIAAWLPWVGLTIGMTAAFYAAIDRTVAIMTTLTAIGFAEGLWIATLAGWPERGNWLRWNRRTIVYIAKTAVVALLAAKLLFVLVPPGAMLALLLTLSTVAQFFLAWNAMLPAPTPAPRQPVSRAALEQLLGQEDRGVQNHMAAVVPLPDQQFRAWSLRAFLWLLNIFFFRSWLPDLYRGKLFGVPTVHFCQWVLLDNRNYLFLSNYDHSWNAYLDDFGANIGTGLQKIWGQGVGNPGFDDVEAFKRYARSTMVPYQTWYSAYPMLSARHIWNNEQIRCRLAAGGDEEHFVDAVRRFAAAPKSLPGFLHAHTR